MRVRTSGLRWCALLLICACCRALGPEHVAPERCAAATRSVLVVGAGPAGASLAYFLSQSPFAHSLNVTIYEKAARVGGRVHDVVLHDALSGTDHRVELGASIFLEGNEILFNASAEFGLRPEQKDSQLRARDGMLYAGERAFAVYDGSAVVFSPHPHPWLFRLAMLWRYGWSLFSGKALGAKALKQFQAIYGSLAGFESPRALTTFIGWNDYLVTTAARFFRSHRIADRYATEIIQGVSRINYAQDLSSNVVCGLVGIIPSPALSVPGGNARIFEQMIARSSATLHLNTTVLGVARAPGGGYAVSTPRSTETYDVVAVAVPLSAGSIAFEAPLTPPAPLLKYVHLHVTIVLGTVDASYFGSSLSAFPKTFLTLPSCESFNSFSTLARLAAAQGPQAAWSGRGVFKVFSNQAVDEKLVSRLFTSTEQVVRAEWDSYPFLAPRDEEQGDVPLASFVVDEQHEGSVSGEGWRGGLYFLNGFEGVMSSMESQSVAGRNLANLLTERLFVQPDKTCS